MPPLHRTAALLEREAPLRDALQVIARARHGTGSTVLVSGEAGIGKSSPLEASPRAAVPTRAWTWAALMRRAFALDVLACPRCGGRLRVIATVRDPLAVQAILAYRARSGAPAPPGPATPAPAATT